MGGRLKTEGMYLYLPLIHIVVQQKLTQKKKKPRKKDAFLSRLKIF